MQCITHEQNEAIDACRSCGKPICSECLEVGAGECARCASGDLGGPSAGGASHAGADADAAPVAATVMSFFVPGLGQVKNRELAKGATLLLVSALLMVTAVQFEERLFVFLGPIWLYGMIDAYYTASGRRARPTPPIGAVWGWVLLGGGLLALAQNLGLPILGPAIVPAVLVLVGVRLLFTYFRGGEERP